MSFAGRQTSLKKALTQSEKHRLYVENGGLTKHDDAIPQFRGARIIECSQNAVEERKLEKQLQMIDEAKHKTLALIRGEQQLLKRAHRDLLQRQDITIAEPLVFQPGFRFHRNGDYKIPKSRLHISDVEMLTIENSLLSAPHLGSTGTLSSSSRSKLADVNALVLRDVEAEVKAIEGDLKKLAIQRKALQNANHTSRNPKVFQRAHTTDVLPQVPSLDEKKIYAVNEQDLRELGRGTHSTDKFSRKCTKQNCMACEFRLKLRLGSDLLQKASKKPTRWKSAPRGVYIGKIEDFSTHLTRSISAGAQKSSLMKAAERIKSSSMHIAANSAPLTKNTRKKSVQASVTFLNDFVEEETLPDATASLEQQQQRQENKKYLSKSTSGTATFERSKSKKFIAKKKSRGFSTEDAYRRVQGQSRDIDVAQLLHELSSDDGSIGEVVEKVDYLIKEDKDVVLPRSFAGLEGRVGDGASGAGDAQFLAGKARSLAVLKKEVDQQKALAASRIKEFLTSLPPNKPSIHRWRSTGTAGGSRSWKTYDGSDDNLPRSKESAMTWGEYHHQPGKLGLALSSHLALSGSCHGDVDQETVMSFEPHKPESERNRNSQEELSKCRYLRVRNRGVNVEQGLCPPPGL